MGKSAHVEVFSVLSPVLRELCVLPVDTISSHLGKSQIEFIPQNYVGSDFYKSRLPTKLDFLN